MRQANISNVRIPASFAALTCAALFITQPMSAGNLLNNGHFMSRSAIQTDQLYSCGGPSSATDWTTWVNATICFVTSGVELETDMLLATSPPVSSIPPAHLIHVRGQVLNPSEASPIQATAAAGIVQVFGPQNTGPTKVLAAVWVYVVHGQVGMGVGNGGNTTANIKSSTQGQWEHLIGYNAIMPANEFVLYGQDPKDNEFYADDAVVCDAEDIYALRLCLPLIYASARPSPLLRAPSSLMVRLGDPPCHGVSGCLPAAGTRGRSISEMWPGCGRRTQDFRFGRWACASPTQSLRQACTSSKAQKCAQASARLSSRALAAPIEYWNEESHAT